MEMLGRLSGIMDRISPGKSSPSSQYRRGPVMPEVSRFRASPYVSDRVLEYCESDDW